ncbi:hypothetical protein [Streptomyces katsurahamanus]|uniref:Uncharacterized protein n=1 Tax=Streptomyces katsurahamanus TaxID=2577098 RepID=A0ABW9NN77_9ACTN|nr:hypothetical protein [Streptomyces katsurahamanus]MQS34762.1 hypothetical protein [Streptomyces katsurahamanus]
MRHTLCVVDEWWYDFHRRLLLRLGGTPEHSRLMSRRMDMELQACKLEILKAALREKEAEQWESLKQRFREADGGGSSAF